MDTVTVLTERQKIFKFPVFGYHVHVVLTNSFKGSVRKREVFLGPESAGWDGDCKALCWNVPNNAVSIIFLPFESDITNIVHESYHAICRLMKWVSAKPEEEVIAYHLDWLVGEIAKFVLKAGNPEVPDLSEKEVKEIISKFEEKARVNKYGTRTAKVKLDAV